MDNYNQSVAVLIARIFLGVLFLIQGYDKIFRIKIEKVTQTFKYEIDIKWVPDFVYSIIAFFSSYIEFIGGFMLLFGFMKYYTLTALGIDLIIVAIGMGLVKPIWNMDIVFPRLVILLFLLIVPFDWDYFSMDYLIFLKHIKHLSI
jgi:putative oxidoreductase